MILFLLDKIAGSLLWGKNIFQILPLFDREDVFIRDAHVSVSKITSLLSGV